MTREIDLSQISTYIPTIDYELSMQEAFKLFQEHDIHDILVVTRGKKPIGIIKKRHIKLALNRKDILVGDITHSLIKLISCKTRTDNLIGLLDLFNTYKDPILVVNRQGFYIGLLFYHVLLHYISAHIEIGVPIFQKLRNLLGHSYYVYMFFLKGKKAFRDEFGPVKEEGLYKVLYEDIKDNIHGDVSFVKDEGEVYALTKERLSKEKIRSIMEDFHKEFYLLYADAKPVYVKGFMINLDSIKSFEDFFKITSELKERVKSVDGSFFIVHDLQPYIITCEYQAKDIISRIKEHIVRDFKRILEKVAKEESDLWEYTLYDFFKEYPYFELFYIMNDKGLQISNNIINPKIKYPIKTGKKGADRSDRAYFKQAMENNIYISDIYISQATDDFCITLSAKFQYRDKSYVLSGDINYREIHKLVKSYAGSY